MRLNNGLRWLTLTLVLALGASLVWGTSQLRLHKSYAIRLENAYQRAFHELVWHIETVENELAKLNAAGTAEQEMEKLATVWRQLYAAQEKVGQLPIGLISLENTKTYLTSTGEHVFALVRQGVGLGATDRAQITNMQQGAAKLAAELGSLQQTVLTKNLRWTEVEAVLSPVGRRNIGSQDNSVVNSLSLVNENVLEYPEVQFDQRIGVAIPKPRLEGAKISQADAEAHALWFLSPTDKTAHQVIECELTTGAIPTYDFILTNKEKKQRINIEITETLGRVLWMLNSAQPSDAGALPIEALQKQATDFLRLRGFKDMRLVGQHVYQGSVLFAYVYEQDGVLIYPDLLRVRLARDNGKVIGFEGNGYTAWHKERQIPKPVVTMENALEALAPNLELMGEPNLAVIFNAQALETLAYEFPVKRGNDHFLVYIDTQTGCELQIVRLETSELPKQAMATP